MGTPILARRFRGLLLVALALTFSIPGFPAYAAGPAADEWREMRVGNFVVLYPPNQEAKVAVFASTAGPTINAAYDLFVRLYGQSPVLPILVRLYPDRTRFLKLNAIVPPIPPEAFHTHIGQREIALIEPLPAAGMIAEAISNIVRHELNGLFLSALSDNRLPPGLELGINQYAEIPGSQTEAALAKLSTARAAGTLLPWNELLEGTAVYLDTEVAYPQSLSIAAFLVDAYGFGSLADLARATADGHGYREALARVYGRPMDRLELEWQAYLPLYLKERWQFNALSNFDLSPLRAVVDAGAYAQVSRGLDRLIPFLEASGQAEARAQAEALRADAQQGIAAGELVKATRDALLSGEYSSTLARAAEAREAYAALGNESRLAEIGLYEARARELLDLQAQLLEASRVVSSRQEAAGEALLLPLGVRFQELGDAEGAQAVTHLLDEVRARREADSRRRTYGVLTLALLVLAHRAVDLVRGRRRGRKTIL